MTDLLINKLLIINGLKITQINNKFNTQIK